jgi:hypothetical protein
MVRWTGAAQKQTVFRGTTLAHCGCLTNSDVGDEGFGGSTLIPLPKSQLVNKWFISKNNYYLNISSTHKSFLPTPLPKKHHIFQYSSVFSCVEIGYFFRCRCISGVAVGTLQCSTIKFVWTEGRRNKRRSRTIVEVADKPIFKLQNLFSILFRQWYRIFIFFTWCKL